MFNELFGKIDIQISNEKEKQKILNLLKRLKKHDKYTYLHSKNVAIDVNKICHFLNFEDNIITNLTIAGLLHDIGKTSIHEIFLRIKDKDDLKEIWEYWHNNEIKPEKDYCELLTVKEIIKWIEIEASNLNQQPQIYSGDIEKEFLKWWKSKNYTLKDYQTMTMKQYLQSHQDKTLDILEKSNFNPNILLYAATHHSSYYSNESKKYITDESIIIEIADKYNAIIQSEGNRTYKIKKTSFEALIIILNELNNQFNFINNENTNNYLIKSTLNYYFNDKNTLNSVIKYINEINNLLENNINGEIKSKIKLRINLFIEYFNKYSQNNINSKYQLYIESFLNIIKKCE